MDALNRAEFAFFGTLAAAVGLAALAASGVLWLGASALTAAGAGFVMFALVCGVAAVGPEDTN